MYDIFLAILANLTVPDIALVLMVATGCRILKNLASHAFNCFDVWWKSWVRRKEKDADAARAMDNLEKLLSDDFKTTKNSLSKKDLPDKYCAVLRAQTDSQHNDDLPDSKSEEPKKPIRPPKN